MTREKLARRLVLAAVAMSVLEFFTLAATRVAGPTPLLEDADASFGDDYTLLWDSKVVARSRLVTPPQSGRLLESVDLQAMPMIAGIALAAGGHNALLSEEHQTVVDALRDRPVPTRADLNYFGIRYTLEPSLGWRDGLQHKCLRGALHRGLLLVGANDDTCLYFNRDRPGIVHMPQAVSVAESVESMVEELRLALTAKKTVFARRRSRTQSMTTSFEPLSTDVELAVIRHELPDRIPVLAPPDVIDAKRRSFGRAVVQVYTDGAIYFATSSNRPAFSVVRESYFPGWRAWVNGELAPVYPAAGLFFAVPTPAGRGEVVLEYRAPGFDEGVQIALGWVLLVCAGEVLRRIVVGLVERRRARAA